MNLPDAHPAQHLRVVAHDAPGIKLERCPPVGPFLDQFGTGAHLPHPGRAVRCDGCELELDSGRCHGEQACRDQRCKLQPAMQAGAVRGTPNRRNLEFNEVHQK